MNIQQVRETVDGIPHMSFAQAEVMTNFILEHKPANVLELGFRHGVSSCYIAGALDELGRGHLDTIDLLDARTAEPNIESLLKTLNLDKYVTVYYEPTSYTWRLMRMLEQTPLPAYDLCYLDGAHSWFVDGLAFFLVDKLLAPGGWLILDDLDWTYATSPALKATDWVKNMPQDEREIPQVRKIYELLVKTHPHYGSFSVRDGWAFAQKLDAREPNAGVRTEVVHETVHVGLGSFLQDATRKVVHTVMKR